MTGEEYFDEGENPITGDGSTGGGGDPANNAAAKDVLFGYTARAFDKTTGLQNNLNRWLDAATGKWLSEDPISFNGGDANLARYVGNHPTMATDPTGLQQVYDPRFDPIFGFTPPGQSAQNTTPSNTFPRLSFPITQEDLYPPARISPRERLWAHQAKFSQTDMNTIRKILGIEDNLRYVARTNPKYKFPIKVVPKGLWPLLGNNDGFVTAGQILKAIGLFRDGKRDLCNKPKKGKLTPDERKNLSIGKAGPPEVLAPAVEKRLKELKELFSLYGDLYRGRSNKVDKARFNELASIFGTTGKALLSSAPVDVVSWYTKTYSIIHDNDELASANDFELNSVLRMIQVFSRSLDPKTTSEREALIRGINPTNGSVREMLETPNGIRSLLQEVREAEGRNRRRRGCR